jgi:Fe-coproporphyrin III synthase
LAVPSFAIPQSRRRLPLVTLYVTERCNSRCITCDYWRHGRIDLAPAAVEEILPELEELGTRLVVLSGGEPLLHPEWARIAGRLKSAGLEVWLLTSGLALAKHARRVTEIFAAVTVSLDGADAGTYAAIRGLDAFDKVCAGVRAAASAVPLNLRVTLQRANYRQLPAFVDLAKRLGASQVSFLAVDVVNAQAFGRAGGTDGTGTGAALGTEDLPELARILIDMERDYATEFASGFIAESPAKLRRIHEYFSALQGRGAYPRVRCNAPEFSAVIDARGRLQPCHFIEGPSAAPAERSLRARLDGRPMADLRGEIRAGRRIECKTCVCSMYRELA